MNMCQEGGVTKFVSNGLRDRGLVESRPSKPHNKGYFLNVWQRLRTTQIDTLLHNTEPIRQSAQSCLNGLFGVIDGPTKLKASKVGTTRYLLYVSQRQFELKNVNFYKSVSLEILLLLLVFLSRGFFVVIRLWRPDFEEQMSRCVCYLNLIVDFIS